MRCSKDSGTAAHGLDAEEDEVAAVEHGDRQQVQDRQVDGQDGHEAEERLDAGPGEAAAHLADHDRAADVARGVPAGEHAGEEVDGQRGDLPRLEAPRATACSGAGPLPRQLPRR
jgi:hypothetical protein